MKKIFFGLFVLSTSCIESTAIQGSKGGVVDIKERPSPQELISEAHSNDGGGQDDNNNVYETEDYDWYDYEYNYTTEEEYAEEPEYEPEYDTDYDYEDVFVCNDGEMIPWDWVCDDFDDCSQGEDEADCPED